MTEIKMFRIYSRIALVANCTCIIVSPNSGGKKRCPRMYQIRRFGVDSPPLEEVGVREGAAEGRPFRRVA